MPKVNFDQNNYSLDNNETVLSCLLRHNIAYPNACKSGVCQSCVTKSIDGEVDPSWQQGLKPTLIGQGYFLACLAKPQKDVTIAQPGMTDITTPATIIESIRFNHNVLGLRFSVNNLNEWTPGQYINLINPRDDIRCYSIANVPVDDGFIEIHIKIVANGKMSEWVTHEARAGTKVHLRGPIGECYYINLAQESFPMVLAGTGTGIAPLVAIVRDALRQGHVGNIHLIHGGYDGKDLYLDNELRHLCTEKPNLKYESCILMQDGVHQQKNIEQVLLDALIDKVNTRLYVCGPPETTNKLKMSAFLAGIASRHIYSDAFIHADS